MKMIVRFGKFNLVGVMGMAVQLGALALFNRWMHGHYMFATAAAIELTLLHNFAWHVCYTWRDRRDDSSRLRQLVRFHLSNGLISMLGNLALMQLLVYEAHLPLLASNLIAIVCCSLANFTLGNNWAFPDRADSEQGGEGAGPMPLSSISLALLVLLLGGGKAEGQTQRDAEVDQATIVPAIPASVPASLHAPPPQSAPAYHIDPSASYLYRAGAICGAGASSSSAATRPTIGCGAGITLLPLPLFFEVGLMAPQANRSYLSGYISLDQSIPLARTSTKYLPMVLVGYSRLFEAGHALDYGLALALPRRGKHRDDGSSIRIELRDYWTFANPAQHNVMLRIGWMEAASD
jgi:putative flippase GtrA